MATFCSSFEEKKTMTTIENKKYKGRGKVFAGLFLLTIGSILLLDRLGVYFPHWLFSWPMFLIFIGFFSGIKHRFTRPGAFIMILIGTIFLADKIFSGFSISTFLWPGLIILAGLFMIFGRGFKGGSCGPNRFRKGRFNDQNHFDWDKKVDNDFAQTTTSTTDPTGDDYIDSVSVFGGVKRNILSKNFLGGEIVNIMGGTEINLSQADIDGRVVLDVTQIFGGTKIILPPHWIIQSEMAAIFGGIEDKRKIQPNDSAPDKILVIKGTSIFGGIDFRNY